MKNLSAEIEKAQVNQIEIQGKKETQEQLYMENMAAILATSLEDGMPCPVCGSIHHEKPQTFRKKQIFWHCKNRKEP